MIGWSRRPAPIRTLLADDSRMIRRTIGRILTGEPGIELVGLASTFQETVQLIQLLKPDVLVIDMGMTAAANGDSAQLRYADVFMVAISSSSDENTVALAQAIGADVFVDKMSAGTDLIPAILGHTNPASTQA